MRPEGKQNHELGTKIGCWHVPLSSYSTLLNHFTGVPCVIESWGKLASLAPPFHAEKILSLVGCSIIWKLRLRSSDGNLSRISFLSRSMNPGKQVFPPATTTFDTISWCIDASHLRSEFMKSSTREDGSELKRSSVHSCLALAGMVICLPNSNDSRRWHSIACFWCFDRFEGAFHWAARIIVLYLIRKLFRSEKFLLWVWSYLNMIRLEELNRKREEEELHRRHKMHIGPSKKISVASRRVVRVRVVVVEFPCVAPPLHQPLHKQFLQLRERGSFLHKEDRHGLSHIHSEAPFLYTLIWKKEILKRVAGGKQCTWHPSW